MNRATSKVTLITDFVLYIISGFLMTVSGLLLTVISGGAGLLIVPGALLFALACLVAPQLFSTIASNIGFLDQEKCAEIVADRTAPLRNVFQIIGDAFKLNPTKPAFAVASVAFGIALLFGLIAFCMFGKMFYNVESPMDWFYKRTKRYKVYSVFCGIYVVAALVGSLSVLFSATGGVLGLVAALVLVNSLLIAFGVYLLFRDRKKSCAKYEALSVEDQIALCDKQAQGMKIRQRKKQIKKLGDDARYSPDLLEKSDKKDKKDKKNKKNKKGKKDAQNQPIEEPVVAVDD